MTCSLGEAAQRTQIGFASLLHCFLVLRVVGRVVGERTRSPSEASPETSRLCFRCSYPGHLANNKIKSNRSPVFQSLYKSQVLVN